WDATAAALEAADREASAADWAACSDAIAARLAAAAASACAALLGPAAGDSDVVADDRSLAGADRSAADFWPGTATTSSTKAATAVSIQKRRDRPRAHATMPERSTGAVLTNS
ncbi:hypothetical protein, partial [Jatrophihabitans sp.]|uniref:hypothetical protein n=1 Tax=Jatrophihabitans sp. TaxID=1932789 RepID=UPI002EE57CAF